MKTNNPSFKLRHRWMLVLATALFAPALAQAQASTYNILLKPRSSTTPLACASGGLTFTKTVAGEFASTSPSVLLSGCATSFVPTIANGSFVPGVGPNVVVENQVIGGNDQGPSVTGLRGTLVFSTTAAGDCRGDGTSTAPKTYTITFTYASTAPAPNANGRGYTITCSGPPGGTFSAGGLYHVVTTNAVPEPGSLWVALLGLGLLAASGRMIAARRTAQRAR